jgi:large subunit ribosomal protein L25
VQGASGGRRFEERVIMISNVILPVQPRTVLGSNESRRLRRAGRIPVSVYGIKQSPFSGSVDAKQMAAFLRTGVSHATIFKLDIPDREAATVVIKDLQVHPVRGNILHADLLLIDMNAKTTVKVSVRFVGEPAGLKQGAILEHGVRELELECLPSDLPSEIVVEVGDLKVGEHVYASDIRLPENVKLISDGHQLVAALLNPRQVEETSASEAPEPEVAKRGKVEKE